MPALTVLRTYRHHLREWQPKLYKAAGLLGRCGIRSLFSGIAPTPFNQKCDYEHRHKQEDASLLIPTVRDMAELEEFQVEAYRAQPR